MIEIKADICPAREQLLSLYADAGWTAYTADPDRLVRAWERSLLTLTAWRDGELAGALRAIGDGETILYVQDLLVRTDCQRQGIGRRLLTNCLERFPDVRQKVLLTDDTPRTAAFYCACGFVPAAETGALAFVRYGNM